MNNIGLAQFKKINIVANKEYVEREAIISDKLTPIVAFSFINTLYNVSHRNEIIVGGNQLIYDEARIHNETLNQQETKAMSAWEMFKANYEKNKNNISVLLDKNVKVDIAQRIEASFQFPVFSLHRANSYSNMIVDTYEQVDAFSKRIINSLNEEVLLSDKYFFAIFDRIYHNLFPTLVGNFVQLIYLPLNLDEYMNFLFDLEKEGLFVNQLDKDLFTQTYCYIEERIMSFMYYKMNFAPLRLLGNEDGTQYFHFESALTYNSEIKSNIEYTGIPVNVYGVLRETLINMLSLVDEYYSYLMPEILNNTNISNENFSLFSDDQKSNMFAVAFSSANMHLLLRLLSFDNKSLYTTIQFRDPILMLGIVYLLNQNNFFYIFVNEELAKTMIYYEDAWNESPMKFADLLIDLTSKFEYYANLNAIVETMLTVGPENPEEAHMYPLSGLDLWDTLKSIKNYTIPKITQNNN